jgi:hypothetical protein
MCQYTQIKKSWQGNPMTPQAQSAHLSGNPLKDYLRLAVILGALLHDLGKGTIGFQRRLWHALKGTIWDGKDPLRHELISVLLINLKSPECLWSAARKGTLSKWFEARCEALRSDESIRQAQDWIRACRTIRHSQGGEGEAAYLHRFNQQLAFNQTQAWSEHPFWMSVLWLVYTHHKLFKGRWQAQTGAFTFTPESHLDASVYDEDDVLHADAEQRVPDYLSFQPTGQPWQSEQWCQAFCNAVACLDDLRNAYPGFEQTLFQALPDQQKGLGQSTTWIKSLSRVGRLSLVLGDYEASCDAVKGSTVNPMQDELYANTKHQGDSLLMGDTLPNHLLKASHWAVRVFDGLLSTSSTPLLHPGRIDHQDAPCAVTQLQLSPDSAYYWQSEVQQAAKALQDSDCGAFVVVAAGTGRGKTKGCATFMANARRSARFSVLLSMRSLTFQTAKAYLQETIGYHPDQVAMFVGDDILKRRFREERKQRRQLLRQCRPTPGTDNQVALHNPEHVVLYSGTVSSNSISLKSLQEDHFLGRALSAPVTVMTVDHVIRTLNLRKSSDLVQLLPLITTDLVLDEIDDYRGHDLVTMGRLIELAGQFGRRVIIASATLPKTIVEGFHDAYRQGYAVYEALHGAEPHRAMVITHMAPYVSTPSPGEPFIECYERTMAAFCEQERQQSLAHPRRILRNSKDLLLPLSKRPMPDGIFRNQLQSISKIVSGSYSRYSAAQAQHHYYQAATASAYLLHGVNGLRHEHIRYSAGAMRFNSVVSAQSYLRWVNATQMAEAYAQMGVTLKFICYHAQNLGLTRYLQESFLDQHLKRGAMNGGGEDPLLSCDDVKAAFAQATERGHREVMIIIVTTSIFETGRDYDLDWAVLEPCSTASIIQFAGRVRRHRDQRHSQINLLVLPCAQEALVNPVHAWRDLKHTPFSPKQKPTKAERKALSALGICHLTALSMDPSSTEEAFAQGLYDGSPLHAGHCLIMPAAYASAPLTSMERVYQLSLFKKEHATCEGFPFTLEYAFSHADTLLCDTFYLTHPFRGGGDIFTLQYLSDAGWICQDEGGHVTCVQHAITHELGAQMPDCDLYLLQSLNFTGYEQMQAVSEAIGLSLGYQEDDLALATTAFLSTQRERDHELLVYHPQLGFSKQA